VPDKYRSFGELRASEQVDRDFRIRIKERSRRFSIIAPHGGGIERGTSEIAEAIAANDFSFYAFEGLRRRHNGELHITSTRFDEPACVALVRRSAKIVAIHGEDSSGKMIYLGGLDKSLLQQLRESLISREFIVEEQSRPSIQGTDHTNICNQGKTRQGVQIELSKGLRHSFFKSFSKAGRQTTTHRFDGFVLAVRDVLHNAIRFEIKGGHAFTIPLRSHQGS
jgi:phage replication-related protein YjqB (UPF0714/DUF867 family)